MMRKPDQANPKRESGPFHELETAPDREIEKAKRRSAKLSKTQTNASEDRNNATEPRSKRPKPKTTSETTIRRRTLVLGDKNPTPPESASTKTTEQLDDKSSDFDLLSVDKDASSR